MGLMLPALRYLVREHKRAPVSGRVLTLGRQCVYATLSDVRALLRAEGVEPLPLLTESDGLTNIPGWNAGIGAGYTSDRAFWASLAGVTVETLDVSPHELPEHAVDLNRPIPEWLAGAFDLVLDGGTLEHIFDVPQALRNIVSLLRPGGRVIHMSPSSNYVEHGFYQFSPTFFFDYYGANRFQDLACAVAEIESGAHWARAPWAIRDCDPATPHERPSPNYQLVLFRGIKGATSDGADVPRQGDYRALRRREAERCSQRDRVADRFTAVWHQLDGSSAPLAVYGAGDVGRIVAARARELGVNVTCFVDRRPELQRTQIDGVDVLTLQDARAQGVRHFVIGSLASTADIADAIEAEFEAADCRAAVYCASGTSSDAATLREVQP